MYRLLPSVRGLVLLVLWGFWSLSVSFSGQGQKLDASVPPSSFEAELLRIDGDRYVVKDGMGLERQVHVG